MVSDTLVRSRCSLAPVCGVLLRCRCLPYVFPCLFCWMRRFMVLLFWLVLVIIAPFLHPANKVGDTPPLPYYLCVSIRIYFASSAIADGAPLLCRYCLVGIAIMLAGGVYWAVWRVVLLRVFGYELVPRKEVLEDGTVVNVVRPNICCMKGAEVDRYFLNPSSRVRRSNRVR
jgi:hypothetical protein